VIIIIIIIIIMMVMMQWKSGGIINLVGTIAFVVWIVCVCIGIVYNRNKASVPTLETALAINCSFR
jgi:hypothetical protein